MRGQGRRQSDNVEDRRGIGGKRIAVGGGLGGLIIVALYFLLGGNPDEVMQSLQTDGTSSSASAVQPLSEKDKEMGDFASAYVIAHEVGHHVQNMLGIMDQVMSKRSRVCLQRLAGLGLHPEVAQHIKNAVGLQPA